jgi:hypothetical protein
MTRLFCFAYLVAFSIGLALTGCTTGLQKAASPEAAGLSSERLKAISTAFQAGVDKKEIRSICGRGGRLFQRRLSRPRTGAPMTRDAIFRIAR